MRKAPERAFVRFIDGLSDEEKAILTGLMVLGRNDNDQKERDFPAIMDYHRKDNKHTGTYLSEKALLADYLRNGLAILRAG